MFNENIKMSDKLISVFSYMTGGFVGIIWQIYCAVTKKHMTKFLLFNIYQAVFLSLLIYMSYLLLMMVYHLLVMIPFINVLVNSLYFALFSPILYKWSLIELVLLIVYIYLMAFSFIGRYAILPWVSNIILYQLKRF